MTKDEAVEILYDLLKSLMNHSFGLDEVEQKRSRDRVEALNFILKFAESEVEEMKINNKQFNKMCKYLSEKGWWGFGNEPLVPAKKEDIRNTRKDLRNALKLYLDLPTISAKG